MTLRFKMALLFFTFPLFAQSKVFNNAYLSFELPDNWNCQLEHTEWVCRSADNKESREAIIILTAKEVGPTDKFEVFEAVMNTMRQVPNRSGGTTTSKIEIKARKTRINNHDWIDGFQMGSEIPNYYTRYVATIKEKLAILFTFSAHRSEYTKYSGTLLKAVQSLRVIAGKNILAGSSDSVGGGLGQGTFGPGMGSGGQMLLSPGTGGSSNKKSGKVPKKYLYLGAGALLLLAGFLLMRKK